MGLQEIHTACQENKAVTKAAQRDPAMRSTMTLGAFGVGGLSPPRALHPSRLQPAHPGAAILGSLGAWTPTVKTGGLRNFPPETPEATEDIFTPPALRSLLRGVSAAGRPDLSHDAPKRS